MNTTTKPIVVGQLSEFNLPTLLHTFGACRQILTLEIVSPSGQATGRVVLKSGKVVGATAGVLTGVRALRKLMYADVKSGFRVEFGGAAIAGDTVVLGSVNELVADAEAASESGDPTVRIRMMQGSLAEFDIATVMQAACLGRQFIELDILTKGKIPSLVGRICLKSGKVMSARVGDIDGVAAIRHLLGLSGNFDFAVYRILSPAGRDREPLGSVVDILLRSESDSAPTLVDDRPSDFEWESREGTPTRVVPPKKVHRNHRWALVLVLAMGALGVAALVFRACAANHGLSASVAASKLTSAEAASPPVTTPPAAASFVAPAVPPLAYDRPKAPRSVALAYDPEVTVAQAVLKELGYDPGPLDGLLGPRTTGAIVAYQKSEHMATIDGTLNAETRAALFATHDVKELGPR